MQLNINEIAQSLLFNGDLLSKMANFFDEDTQDTAKAVNLSFPTVIGALAKSVAGSDNNANDLLAHIQNGGHDGTMLDSLGILLGGGSATQGFIKSGDAMVSALFGKDLSAVVDNIAGKVGVKTGTVSSLMSIAAPFVMNIIGKNAKSESGFGASALMSLMQNQGGFLKGLLPSDLRQVAGLAEFVPSDVALSKMLADTKAAEIPVETSFLSKIMPWAIMGVVTVVGLFLLKKNIAPAVPQIVPVQEVVQDSIRTIALAEGNIQVQTGSFLDKLDTEIRDTAMHKDTPLTFDNVQFMTGKSDLTEASKLQLQDLVKIMKGYAKVEIRIEGHTDNQGDVVKNKKLSEDRAASVKKFLVANGIAATRITTAGFGAEKPIAPNDAEEGRAKNRRIEAFVVKK